MSRKKPKITKEQGRQAAALRILAQHELEASEAALLRGDRKKSSFHANRARNYLDRMEMYLEGIG